MLFGLLLAGPGDVRRPGCATVRRRGLLRGGRPAAERAAHGGNQQRGGDGLFEDGAGPECVQVDLRLRPREAGDHARIAQAVHDHRELVGVEDQLAMLTVYGSTGATAH